MPSRRPRAAPHAPIPLRDLEPTLEGLLAFAVAATGAAGGAFYLLDEEHGDLVLAQGHGLPKAAIGHRLAVGEGLVGLAVKEGHSVASHDVAMDLRARPRRPDWDAPPPVRGFLGLPLRTGSVVLGVLELTSPRTDVFAPSVRGQAALFADAAGLLIEEMRLASHPPPAALADEPLSRDPLGLATLDERLHVTSANAALCRLLGLPLEAVVSRPVIVVVPALARPAGRDALQAALHGGPAHLGAVPTTTSDGERAVLSVSVLPLGSPTGGLMLVALDVSERARLESELRSRHAVAAEARDRLRAVVEVVSHELRTPLTSVLGFAQLLEDSPGATEPERAKWAAVIAEKARLMARLVGEITDLARLGSDRFELHLEATDLPRLVRRVASELGAGPDARTVEVASEPVPEVIVDADRLEQVFANLITNALKFSDSDQPVEITVSPAGEGVAVAVQDRGPGIPEAYRTRIFEPFYRIPGATEGVGGSGLGLAVCQGIIAAHGGRVDVSDREGGGAVFSVWIPVRPRRPPAAPRAS